MADPFTIRIFVPDGDPEGVRLIDRMNWTGLGLVFRRSDWSEVRKRTEMQRTGIYVLVGYRNEDDDLLVGLRAFEFPKAVAAPRASDPLSGGQTSGRRHDTIIVPAKKDGFEEVFLGEDCWYAVRISGGMLDKIKHIAAYQTQPVSAITHYAPVSSIEPYGESGKYKLVFSESAKPIGPIPYGDAPQGAMQGPRYTSFSRLQKARKLTDVLGKS